MAAVLDSPIAETKNAPLSLPRGFCPFCHTLHRASAPRAQPDGAKVAHGTGLTARLSVRW
jgi:hypothetical protein